MGDKEYKKYNSDVRTDAFNIRLTADAEVLGENFVKFTFAAESAQEDDSTMWIDVIPLDAQAPIASFLKKGDVIPCVTGRITLRMWGENKDKPGFTMRGAYLHLDPSFIAELKERGFVPGTKSTGGGGKGKSKPASKAPANKGRRPVVNLDDDDEE